MANNKITVNITYPELLPQHPGYTLYLMALGSVFLPMAGLPAIVFLNSENPRAIHLSSWCEGEVIGGPLPHSEDIQHENYGKTYDVGEGHDCLTLWTPSGLEISLSEKEKRELTETLEIMLGKRQPAIVIPQIDYPKSIKEN